MPDRGDDDRMIEYRQYGELDNDDPLLQVKVLAVRVSNLTREKERIEQNLKEEVTERRRLEDRVAGMERSFQRGAGALVVLPVLGTLIGIVMAYGKVILAPWTGGK